MDINHSEIDSSDVYKSCQHLSPSYYKGYCSPDTMECSRNFSSLFSKFVLRERTTASAIFFYFWESREHALVPRRCRNIRLGIVLPSGSLLINLFPATLSWFARFEIVSLNSYDEFMGGLKDMIYATRLI
ncbi:hypothetical protein CEXT_437741 [Caerostris extrusa]|uniref:Uncharacterized protein n=1 Tax=Caerostris extrusa TaxID=172846 RepID=A0AAV4YBK8_CAEEX|nr:hypothetical protein CEXT_437741 [Caerostris extrusa]